MKIWAVYTQFEPTFKYEASLLSLWSTKELALREARKQKHYDHIWVQELNVDSDYMISLNSHLEKVHPK